MKKYILTLLCFVVVQCLKSQSIPNIIIPNPTPNPPVLASDSYTRASSSIKLQNGFKYGFVSANPVATNLLNLNISSYPNYVNNNYNNPDDMPGYYDPNPNAVVGITDGVANVSSTGSFQYNFPIKCSPGTAGMQPNLSVSYNSNGANSWLGVGFNLSGISSINRIGKTAFYDGLNGSVNFDANDVFSLDGERLLLANNATYGQPGATYKLENENYELITSYGTQGSGPEYFIINTRDGRIIEYGKPNGSNPANSRNTAKNSSEILNWCINKITDQFGNYMTYNYINTDGEMLVDKIEYTGNGSFQPYNKISFTYIDRSDNSSSFVAGKEFSRKKLLKRITCTDINNNVVRQYDLEYDYKFASFLNKITETDALGNSLNPTFIDWTKNEVFNTINVATIAQNPQTVMKTIAADVNGDGFQDIVLIKNPTGPSVEIKLGNASFGYFVDIQSALYANTIISASSATILSTFVFDEDDDNRDEVFILYVYNSSPLYSIAKLKFNGTAYDVTSELAGIAYPQNTVPHMWSALKALNPHANWSGYFYGKEDVTGDDKRDIILVDQFKISITPSNAQPEVTLNVPNLIKAELGDYNGDGIMEIYTLKYTAFDNLFDVGIYAYNNTLNTINLTATQQVDIGTNPNIAAWSPLSLSGLLAKMENAAKSISFSDMDGDNKTDIFFINYNSTSGTANYLRSTGAGFITNSNPIPVSLTLNGDEAVFFTADVNNDGKSDMVATSYNQAQKFTNYTWFPSNNDGFVNHGQILNFYDEYVGVMGDFDGDGLLDYAYQWSLTSSSKVTFSMFGQDNKRLVNRIYNIKNNYKIYYKWLNSSNLYRKTTYANSTNFKAYMPKMFVVHGTDNNDEELNRYMYENGLLHEGKKGFLGFEKTCVYNANTTQGGGLYLGSITSYMFDPTHDYVSSVEAFTGYIQTSVANTSPIVFSTISSYNKTDLSYVVTGTNHYLSGSETDQKNYLSSTRSHTSKTYDNANGGNILSSVTESKTWSGSSVIRTDEAHYIYVTSGSTPVTRLEKIKSISVANGNTAEFHTRYVYDLAGHLKTKTENFNLPALAITTTYDLFNAYGAPTTVNVAAPDISNSPARTSVMVYDNTGRFVTKTTNAIGNFEEYTYEPGLGNKLSEKSISGLISTYAYDGMGRMIMAKLPNNSTNTFSYEWYNYPLSQFFSAYGIKVTSNIEGIAPSVAYSDFKGNTIKQETTGFNGATEITEATYDIFNRLVSKSEPHYLNQSSYKSYEYHYDNYSRPTEVREIINQSQVNHVDYQYNNLSTNSQYNKGSVTTITKNSAGNGSLYVIKENNAAGQVDKIINYGGNSQHQTAVYQFNEFNQPSSITTSFPNGTGDAVTLMEYDELGRQNKLEDPSSGVTTYIYNSIGQLTVQATPEGTYSYAYDVLGRITQKSGTTQGTTYYSYVTAANGKQQLQTISGPEVLTDYTYDNLGRATEFKEKLVNTNKVFKTKFTYDKYGRVVNYTYPNGFVTTNEYDNAGMLVKIKNNSSILWQLTAMHTPALPAQYTYTNGLNTTLAYDSKFNLKTINAGTLSKQVYSTNYDNGDLLSRQHINYATGLDNSENFTYDEFDRLREVAYDDGNHNTTIRGTYDYHDNGNFVHKNDCGDYVYGDPLAPYKLTQVDNPGPDVSLNTFNVTYNDLKKVSHIEDATASKEFNFLYGNDDNRIKMDYLVSSQNQYTRYYQPNYDREESGNDYKEWCYVYAPTGLCAINYKENNTEQTLHVTTDNLGSPVLLTDINQNIVEENNFDPWGRRREPGNWNNFLTSSSSLLIRGFQMHEMLDEASIINMNGRIYDPVIGRFLQADIIIQEPDNLQNFNRYSYCFNNPLKYTDPSGYKNVTSPSPVVDWTNPSSAQRNIEPPKMYVDGMPITTGGPGYGFWGSGAAGGAGATQNFGVWTGNGPGQKNFYVSRGTIVDYVNAGGEGVSLKGNSAHVQMKAVDYGQFVNPIDGRTATDYESMAVMQWTDIAQSGGGADFKAPNAEVQSVNFAFSFGGGYSFEIGVITDSKTKENKYFFSHGPTIGFGLSIGGNVKELRATKGGSFSIKDYEGAGSGYNAGYILGAEYSGNRTNSSYQNSDWKLGGDNYNQFGWSTGFGLDFGLMWSRTNTTFIK